MKRLSKVVNIVPVIAKADTLTLEERVHFKQRVGFRLYPPQPFCTAWRRCRPGRGHRGVTWSGRPNRQSLFQWVAGLVVPGLGGCWGPSLRWPLQLPHISKAALGEVPILQQIL